MYIVSVKNTLIYNRNRDQFSCDAQVLACTGLQVDNNGGDSSNAATFSGTYTVEDSSSCIIDSCNNNYTLAGDSLSCSPTLCTSNTDLNTNLGITGFAGIENISGDLVNGCDYTCQSKFFKLNGQTEACLSNQCQLSDAQSNGATITFASSATGTKSSIADTSNCLIGSCNTDYYVSGGGLNCIQSSLDENLAFDSGVNFFNETPDETYTKPNLNDTYSSFDSSGVDLSAATNSAGDTTDPAYWRAQLLNSDSYENTEAQSAPLNAKWKAMWYKIQQLKQRVDTLETN